MDDKVKNASKPDLVFESSEENLPNLHQKIQFQEVGKKKLIIGKVKNKVKRTLSKEMSLK
jgi:hypothetical protein